jgi:hypothetical protein
MTNETPAPPPAGAPEEKPTSAQAIMRAVKVERVTLDEIWQMCSRYCEHKDGWAKLNSEVNPPTDVCIGAVFSLAKERDIFYGICRLVELIKDDPEIQERIRALAVRQRAEAAAAIAAHDALTDTQDEVAA